MTGRTLVDVLPCHFGYNEVERNAIQVMNIGGAQVGHIPKNVAAHLSPLLDRKLVTSEGVMHEGKRMALSHTFRRHKLTTISVRSVTYSLSM